VATTTKSPPRSRPGSGPGAGPTHEGEEICHVVTWEDPNTALCGKDVSGYPWNPPWPMFVVCVDLYEQGCG
jgi:hypothetical protein